ncbi:DUF4440 domain-containing protein [Comamonas suwonensis]|uniref:DUF4440 domain-containing protein n=1 Tax=Comamonas suwonensis TaxID=2606214 RepID=UPI00145E7B73|nr:DUF4440 domain-containing protein [Comamonas suwonensis]MBI1625044.1 DUF4440 domain-containing protein [Comamonas suwonensis]
MRKISWTAFALACAVLTGCASNSTQLAAVTAAAPASRASAQSPAICKAITEPEVAALFDRWNQSLKTGRAEKVVQNYAARSILLPTVSNKLRLSAAEKEDYFVHFLENQPVGSIDMRFVDIGCNTALDAGLYTFSFAKTGTKVSGRYSFTYGWDGQQWLITSHHSSVMPGKD